VQSTTIEVFAREQFEPAHMLGSRWGWLEVKVCLDGRCASRAFAPLLLA
jgi:hypothetical protein